MGFAGTGPIIIHKEIKELKSQLNRGFISDSPESAADLEMSPNSNSGNTMYWMYRMVSEPYYLLHFLTFFSYITVRISVDQVFNPLRSAHLLHREIQALLAFSVLAAIKLVKTESWEAFVADTLFYAKILLAAVALIVDYHLALWYALAFFGDTFSILNAHFYFYLTVIYIMAQQPAFGGPGTTNYLTPLQLETLLTEGNTSKYLMVEFRSLSTSSCVLSSSFFPELSITFSNKHLSFGIVDLGLFPNAADKFGISLESLHQLPTYILFHGGAEISRLPELDTEANFFGAPVSKKLLCRHFELDKLLLDYIHGK